MTPEEAIHYLVDQMRTDNDLRAVLTAAATRSAVEDVYAWAETHQDEVVLLAESWQGVVEQEIPAVVYVPLEDR